MPTTKPTPLTLFVAMPYTQLGTQSKWHKPQEVEDFYKDVAKAISRRLKRPVLPRIEKSAPKSGLVIGEMFQAIQNADILIADITGGNVNVFLELGVRYGVSEKVTIVTTQEDTPPPFDINQIAVVRYAHGSTRKVEKHIAEIVAREWETTHGGSPVLQLLGLKPVPRQQWEIFSGERIRLMIHQARSENRADARIALLREAVEMDPFSIPAHTELQNTLREAGQLSEALQASDDAVRRLPHCVQLLKARGKLLDKISATGEDRLQEAIDAFSEALILSGGDSDLHGCLGGVFRRHALTKSGTEAARLLRLAFEHYQRSLELNRHSTYAGMNLLRLTMLGVEPQAPLIRKPDDYLTRMFHLCAFEVADMQSRGEGEVWWPLFDLADILVLQDELDRAIETYQQALEAIPPLGRLDRILSPLRTWRELVESGSLARNVARSAEKVIHLLEKGAQPAE